MADVASARARLDAMLERQSEVENGRIDATNIIFPAFCVPASGSELVE